MGWGQAERGREDPEMSRVLAGAAHCGLLDPQIIRTVKVSVEFVGRGWGLET